MKYLIITLIILFGFASVAYGARFDFTNGQPAVMDDGAVSDTTEQTRYDFTNGQPSPIFDATVTEVTPPEAETSYMLKVNNGGIIINNGGMILR